MFGLGALATGAAFINYKKAQADYDALVEKRAGLLAAVQTFNNEKDKDYLDQLEQEYKQKAIDIPEDIKCTAILRTSYLVGKMFRCIASVVLTNLSDKTYEIGTVAADCFVKNGENYVPILVYNMDIMSASSHQEKQEKSANVVLHPNETIEVSMPKGLSSVPDMEALRQMVCDACGKRLITSCPKVSIENGIKADIMFTWREQGETDWHRAVVQQKNGIFRYCMELPLHEWS